MTDCLREEFEKLSMAITKLIAILKETKCDKDAISSMEMQLHGAVYVLREACRMAMHEFPA